MKKVVKIVGLCSPPLQQRYLAASGPEQERLRPILEQERGWIMEKMHSKGYRLEGTVVDVLGIFTRGPARGAIRLCEREATITP
jgi:hypothetical protein